jgi:predicted acetyltransferase
MAPTRPAIDHRLSEFFVLRRFRRLGVGRDAAQLIFNRFAGQWEVTEYLRNAGAVSFWRRVIAAYTRGTYTERIIDGEVRQLFRSVPSPLRA